ncbi:electron transport complex, RnfABCDGE type, C subunit [Psychromonas ingrahamii 37]|uniref:Ion-translocating oxidoreductase complex subunit C n=1 Tax=Psychromonas ingrahamii (strain DSM 17664 / CCUG 51855 / 37) TaxID=357804 RepID=A1SSX3_PSYIN|nr:electron transport complex subunit RsxC [Psychromonas ingrahamii]ABM02588.1 electron transport complex, RnfABCDGE type, C subunit [Psychromonas ingrahamii 37]
MTTKAINLLSDAQLAQVSSGKQWSFHGGIHPAENKQSSQIAITDAGIPPYLVISIDHKGYIPELLVKVGDPVLKGQALTKVYGAMVVQHASSSGFVYAIEKRTDLHPSGLAVLSIVIETDGLDRSIAYKKPQDYQTQPAALLIDLIQQSGIIGMGGGGFPSHLKLSNAHNVKLLIINAIECEPYITADDRLMQEHADQLITGIEILQHILKPTLTIFAIEDNKPQAIAAINLAIKQAPESLQKNLRVSIIATRYPSGGEKQLIEMITGQQIPLGQHPTALGIVMYNVGTVFAVKEAIIDGKPLISRIVTLTGDAFKKKGNANVRIGTPIQYLLEQYGLEKKHVQKLLIGGPMMGFTITHTDIPVSKSCNCILVPTPEEMPEPPAEMPCIRCGECSDVCPAVLLPQQLLWYSKSQDHEKLDEYNLPSCIECGACAFVCPSNIPLVEYYRVAKAEIRNARQEAQKAETARIRHENRAVRLEQAKLERQAKHQAAAEKRKQQSKEKNGGQDLIAAALERAKAKKQRLADTAQIPESESESENETKPADNKKDAVAAAIARAKAKKQATTETTQTPESESETKPADNKKDAVAAAIARAKAKKQAAAETTQTPESESETKPADNKKDAVGAAIARAKAKKQAAAETTQTPESESEPADNKKDAVAAAIARAKAKKQAAAETTQTTEGESKQAAEKATQEPEGDVTESDNKKNAVATAIARAKAKKKAAAETTQEPEGDVTAADNKKDAVATAIARAKAKKKAAAETTQEPEGDVTAADNKKQAAQTVHQTSEQLPDNSEAIQARKLRKEQVRLHKQELDSHQSITPQETANKKSSLPADDRKAKIAAAIAKAKAQKTAHKD